MNKIDIFSINDFETRVAKKKIVLFGAGRAMRGLFLIFAGKSFLNQIVYIVDNNKTLQNTMATACGKKIAIKSPDYLADTITSDNVILVTTELHPEIYSQLASMPQLKDTPIISAVQLKNLQIDEQITSVNLPDSFHVYKEQKIPKVIHYCWFGGNPIPAQYKEWMASWKRFCPDYEIVEWNERNYDYKKNSYMEQAYKSGKWAFVTDYARLDLIYKYGGLYFDTDVELIKNMDDFLFQDGFGGYCVDRRFSTGLGIGAREKLPIMKKFRDLYNDRVFVDFDKKSERWSKNIKLTPDILTEYINKCGFKYTNGIVDIEGFRIYPAPVLCGMIGNKLYTTDKTYTIHHFAGSWVPHD